MTILFICSIVDWISTGEAWSDFLIPLIAPIIGVIGAYLIMRRQIETQQNREDLLESEQNELYRSTYIINLQIAQTSLPKLQEQARQIRNKIDDPDYRFLFVGAYSESFEVLLKQDYQLLFKGFRPYIQNNEALLNGFLLSYNAAYSLYKLQEDFNKEVRNYVSKSTTIKDMLSVQSSDIVTKIKFIVLDRNIPTDVKDIIRRTYDDLNLNIEPDNEYLKRLKKTTDSLFNLPVIHQSSNPNLIELVLLLKEINNNFIRLTDAVDQVQTFVKKFDEQTIKESNKVQNFLDLHSKTLEYLMNMKIDLI